MACTCWWASLIGVGLLGTFQLAADVLLTVLQPFQHRAPGVSAQHEEQNEKDDYRPEAEVEPALEDVGLLFVFGVLGCFLDRRRPRRLGVAARFVVLLRPRGDGGQRQEQHAQS